MKFIKYLALTVTLLTLLTACTSELPTQDGQTNEDVPFDLLFKKVSEHQYSARYRVIMNAPFSKGISFGPDAIWGEDVRLGLVSLKELSNYDLTVTKNKDTYEIINRN